MPKESRGFKQKRGAIYRHNSIVLLFVISVKITVLYPFCQCKTPQPSRWGRGVLIVLGSYPSFGNVSSNSGLPRLTLALPFSAGYVCLVVNLLHVHPYGGQPCDRPHCYLLIVRQVKDSRGVKTNFKTEAEHFVAVVTSPGHE